MERVDFSAAEALYRAQKERFDRFFAMLREANGKFNLTAVTGERETFYKHFLDSLAGEPFFPRGANVAEVGSGAGFPSVPIMLVREDLRFTLIESTGKKCAFLRDAVREMGLRAEVVHARAEELGKDAAFRERFGTVCARAVARLNTLAEYCLPLVKRGGRMIAYKGAEDETEEAKNAIARLGGGRTERVLYELPEGMGRRMLVITEKTGATPAAYPRGQGAERRRPIV